MSEEFNKEFMKLSEKDQKSILNLIQLKNMNKQTEYKRRIDKAIEYIEEYGWQEDIISNTCSGVPMIDKYMRLDWDNCNELLNILKGEDNNE